MQIDFPKLCTIAYANKIIENCLKAKKGTKPVIFHFDRTTWIDPFAITVIAGTIQCCSKCFVCAQYYPAKMTIRFCIADFGIGILSTLREKYDIIHDIEAIKLAVKAASFLPRSRVCLRRSNLSLVMDRALFLLTKFSGWRMPGFFSKGFRIWGCLINLLFPVREALS